MLPRWSWRGQPPSARGRRRALGRGCARAGLSGRLASRQRNIPRCPRSHRPRRRLSRPRRAEHPSPRSRSRQQ
eukprot:8333467-Alexandrium_andersonii.AAC.1